MCNKDKYQFDLTGLTEKYFNGDEKAATLWLAKPREELDGVAPLTALASRPAVVGPVVEALLAAEHKPG